MEVLPVARRAHPDWVVGKGEPLMLSANVKGTPVDRATLFVNSDEEERKITLVGHGSDPIAFSHNVRSVEEPFAYRFRAGDGQTESLVYAYNVVASEGNLAIVDEQQMSERLADVVYEFHRAGDLAVSSSDSGQNLSETILYVLVAILIGEQLLAYAISYHPPAREAAAT